MSTPRTYLGRRPDGSVELMATCFLNVPHDIRELRVRADAGFGYHPVLEILEARPTPYTVVARVTPAFKRLLPGLRYESVNQQWEMAELEYRPHGWPQARRFVVARRFIPDDEEPQSTLFALSRYVYRAWVTNMDLTPPGSGTIMMGVPPWNPESANCGKTMPFARFLPPHLRPMRYTWKSFALPITWSLPSSGLAWRHPGRVSPCRSSATSYFSCPANSPVPKTGPLSGWPSPAC
jgi:hypothetical protein